MFVNLSVQVLDDVKENSIEGLHAVWEAVFCVSASDVCAQKSFRTVLEYRIEFSFTSSSAWIFILAMLKNTCKNCLDQVSDKTVLSRVSFTLAPGHQAVLIFAFGAISLLLTWIFPLEKGCYSNRNAVWKVPLTSGWVQSKSIEKAQSLWEGDLLDILQNYSHKFYIHSTSFPLGCHHARRLCSELAECACYPPLCASPCHSQTLRYVTREACTQDLWPRVGVPCTISEILGVEPVSRESIAMIEWEIIIQAWLPTTKNNTCA